MIDKINNKYNIILATASPRRQQLVKDLGIEFTVQLKDSGEEVYPDTLSVNDIPIFLAKQKANPFDGCLLDSDLLITADTIVYTDKVLGKPSDYNDAFNMIKSLSGNSHEVITGVCIKSTKKVVTFYSSTKVYFNNISDEEIEYYINNYKPYDKAGAYGIQEWIGFIGIERIEGSFYNVMGLPVQRLYEELKQF